MIYSIARIATCHTVNFTHPTKVIIADLEFLLCPLRTKRTILFCYLLTNDWLYRILFLPLLPHGILKRLHAQLLQPACMILVDTYHLLALWAPYAHDF